MSIYADSSFLVSLYLPDVHSREARRRMSKRPQISLTALHGAEWAHALAQAVFQQRISHDEARQLYSAFAGDRERGPWLQREFPLIAFETCAQLATRHGARLGLGTLDTLHVACALELQASQFWTYDQRQAKLARTVGLKIS